MCNKVHTYFASTFVSVMYVVPWERTTFGVPWIIQNCDPLPWACWLWGAKEERTRNYLANLPELELSTKSLTVLSHTDCSTSARKLKKFSLTFQYFTHLSGASLLSDSKLNTLKIRNTQNSYRPHFPTRSRAKKGAQIDMSRHHDRSYVAGYSVELSKLKT